MAAGFAKAGSPRWWAGKVRQAFRHVVARVSPRERAAVAVWLTPPQLRVFDGMHVADRRHGLDVVAALRGGRGAMEPLAGDEDLELLVAGLLHDAGKGDTGMLPRIAYSLGQAYGPRAAAPFRVVPGMTDSLERLRDHAETSAALAEAAGCSPRTAELIRWQDAPRDPIAGERLRLADEAS